MLVILMGFLFINVWYYFSNLMFTFSFLFFWMVEKLKAYLLLSDKIFQHLIVIHFYLKFLLLPPTNDRQENDKPCNGIIKQQNNKNSDLGHIDKVLITTCLGSRGLEKKIVVYISPENMGDFLAIVKVSRVLHLFMDKTGMTTNIIAKFINS